MKAVITGATSGIGRDMAQYLAKKGWSLILTGRNQQELDRLRKNLPVPVETITLDLADKRAPFTLYNFCRGKKVDLLINNAGFGLFGPFHKTSLKSELEMIDVNIRAVHILSKLFLHDFRLKNHGGILNVASSAGFLTGPLMSTYYASKNYVVRLSLAMAEELRREGSNVQVSVLCPGPVKTNFNKRAGVNFRVPPVSSKAIAEYSLEQMFAGKELIVPGALMKLSLFGAKFVPHRLLPFFVYELQSRRKK